MNARNRFNRLSMFAGAGVMVLVIAACAIKLRDEDQISSASSVSPDANPLAAKLARCRTVTPDQTDSLTECRRIWTEQRRQFLGQKNTQTKLPNDSAPNIGFAASAPRKDKSRLAPGWPSAPISEGE